jgi:hypothetical protein
MADDSIKIPQSDENSHNNSLNNSISPVAGISDSSPDNPFSQPKEEEEKVQQGDRRVTFKDSEEGPNVMQ